MIYIAIRFWRRHINFYAHSKPHEQLVSHDLYCASTFGGRISIFIPVAKPYGQFI